jgi:predicted porin
MNNYMNKKLFAVAVASAIAAPVTASAGNSLTVYGGVGIAVETIDNGINDALAINNNHSAIGFEGNTDISDGLAAVFHWDAFVDLDAGGGNSGGNLINGGRDGWAGLRGSFGTVALGFQGRPWKTLSHALDPFEGTIADYSAVMGNTGNNGEYFDGGIGNAIIWFTPNWEGFSGHAQLGVEDSVGGAANSGFQGNYKNDQFLAGLSYDVNENTGASGDDTSVLKLVGSFNFGKVATLTAAYEQIDGIGFVSGAERNAIWIAGTFHVGAHGSFRAAYATADDVEGVTDSGADQFSFGYYGNLSDDATWYAIYTGISNDVNANYGFVSAPHTSSFDSNLTGVAGQDSDAVSIGFKYNFNAKVI